MDTIANLLTSIRNAEMARHTQTIVPASKASASVLAILKENGYVQDFSAAEGKITILLSKAGLPHSYRRISKPGRRLYVEAKNIPTVRNGKGMVILFTSQGAMSGKTAKKQKVGGELVCEVY